LGQRQDELSQIGQRERVDDDGTVVEGELHDHEPRRIGALRVELGVQRDARRIANSDAELIESVSIRND
jgi:hypothetical protein